MATAFTTPTEIKQSLRKQLQNGELFKKHFAGLFPLTVQLRHHPGSRSLNTEFDRCSAWARSWYAEKVVFELKQMVTRRQTQNVPVGVIFKSLEDVGKYVGCSREIKQALAAVELTRSQLPELIPFLTESSPGFLWQYVVGAPAGDFALMLQFCRFLKEHPRPDIYLRSLDLPGMDTKFAEQHLAALSRLLDALLPESAVDTESSGRESNKAGFAKRYGFKSEPSRIRFRLLDYSKPENGLFNQAADIEIDKASFLQLRLQVKYIFITENQVNFLAFPDLPQSMVIFGRGFGFASWRRCALFHQPGVHLIYWGDLDAAGFEILNQLRLETAPLKVHSLLMDYAALITNLPLAVSAQVQTAKQLTALTAGEAQAYQDIIEQRHLPNLRIEQERIPFGRVQEALEQMLASLA